MAHQGKQIILQEDQNFKLKKNLIKCLNSNLAAKVQSLKPIFKICAQHKVQLCFLKSKTQDKSLKSTILIIQLTQSNINYGKKRVHIADQLPKIHSLITLTLETLSRIKDGNRILYQRQKSLSKTQKKSCDNKKTEFFN